VNFGENDQVAGPLGKNRPVIRWAYEHDLGDVSDVIQSGENSIVAVLTTIDKPGLPSETTLRPMVEQLVRNEKKAAQIISGKFKGASLEAFATGTGTAIQKADSVTFNNAFVPGIGNDMKFTGACFNKNSKGTDPIAGNAGVFAVRVDQTRKLATPISADATRQAILQNQRMAFSRGLSALHDAAKIEDFRSKFYQ